MPPNLNFLCLTWPSASFAPQFGDFVPRDRSAAAKGPFPRCDWLPKRAKCTVDRYCPICSLNDISLSRSGCPKVFCGKIFSVISPVWMEQENRNTPSRFQITGFLFSARKEKKGLRSFFSVFFMPYNKYFIDQGISVKMAGCWPRSLFAFLWTSTSSRSI